MENSSFKRGIELIISDFLEVLFLHGEDPVAMSNLLTEQLREIIGGKTVMLTECRVQRSDTSALVSICPKRRRELIKDEELSAFAQICRSINEATLISINDNNKSIEPLLLSLQSQNCLVVPISLGGNRVGTLYILDIIEIEYIEGMMQAFNRLIPLIALILKYNFSFHEQQAIISEQGAEIAEQKLLFETLTEHSPDMLVRITPSGKILYANRKAHRFFGNEKGIRGGHFFEILGSELGVIKDNVLSLLIYGGDTLFEHAYREYILNIAIVPEVWNNAIVSFLIILRDVSNQKHLEKELALSEKMRLLGQLSSGIAHDFNNQLSVIRGYTDLIGMSLPKSSQLHQYLEYVGTAVTRSAELTKKLLSYARKGSEKIQIILVDTIVAEVINMVQRSFPKKITVSSNIISKDNFIMGDITEFQNALLNLMINARDAMPQGGPITLTLSKEKIVEDLYLEGNYLIRPNSYIKLEITDSGTGIEKAVLNKIFEPFFTTKEEGKGTGMGLAAVYGTIKSYGGYVTVDSVVGEGTIFTLRIPEALESDDLVESHEKPLDEKGLQELDVWVVDDERMICNILKQVLTSVGAKVTLFSESSKFFELIISEALTADVVLLDLDMPQINGLSCLENIRIRYPLLPVIIISGLLTDEVMEKCALFKPVHFVAKPFKKENIIEAINTIFQESEFKS